MRSLGTYRVLAAFVFPSSLAAFSAGCALSDAATAGAELQETAASTSSALETTLPTRARILFKGTPYCVGMTSPYTNGAHARVSPCDDPNAANPVFDIKSTDDGYYTIVSEVSGLCLDVLGGASSGGTLGQWTCAEGDNQKFRIAPIPAGTPYGVAYTIVPKHSGGCLHVYDWRNRDEITDAQCVGAPLVDLFTFEEMPSVPVTAPAGDVVALGPLKVANTSNCVFAYGMNNVGSISQYTCLGSADQTFEVRSSGDGVSYTIVSSNSQKCLNVAGGNVADHAAIIQYDCKPSSTERFVPSLNSDGTYQLAAMNSGKCLNVPDLGSVVQLEQVACNGSANQKFILPPAPKACTKVVTTSLNESNPYGVSVAVRYVMVGGGGGASTGGGGGGGGSSAILTGAEGTTLVSFAAGGAGGSTATYSAAAGSNGTVAAGSFSLETADKLSIFVGGGGGAARAGSDGGAGGGGSGFFGGGGGGKWAAGAQGGGGSGTAGGGGGAGGGEAGGSGVGGNGIALNGAFGGANGANGGNGGEHYGVSGGGGFGSGGGSTAYPYTFAPGGSNGGNGGSAVRGGGGLGANSFNVTGAALPVGAGAGGTVVDDGYSTAGGGNAGIVVLTYLSPSGVCSL